MRSTRSWPALGLGLSLAVPAEALAQEPELHLELEYRSESAPADCPSAEELRASLAAQLGYEPFGPSPAMAPRRVRVEIARSGSGSVARIVWLDAGGGVTGERALSSESNECSELASGVVFAIAVQLQLLAASSAEPAPEPAPKPLPPPVEKRALAAEAQPARRSVLAGAGIFAQRGWQPGVAVGLRTFGAWRADWWAFVLDAHATLPTTERVPAGGGFSARELALSLAPCFRRGLVDLCALGRVGFVSVKGEGVDDARAPRAPQVALGVRLQLVWPELARLVSLAHLDLLAQLFPRDVLLNRERVWSTAPLAVALGVDVAALFK